MEIYQLHSHALSAFREVAKLPPKVTRDLAAFFARHMEELTSPAEAYKLTVQHPVKGVEQPTVFALIDALTPFLYEVLPGNTDVDEMAQSLVVSVQRIARTSQAGPLTEPAARKLRANLLTIFDNDEMRLKAKALRLMNAHERTFISAEVFSDIRPVLQVDGGLEIEAAVVYHTLRVRHTAVDRLFSVALDSQDLRELKTTIDRAIEKEQILSALLLKAGVKQVKVS